MNRRRALAGVAVCAGWLLDQVGRHRAALARDHGAMTSDGPAKKPWDTAVLPELTIDQTEVAPGDRVVHLRLSLDRDPFMTVRVLLTVSKDHAHGFDGSDFQTPAPYVATWSPGDDLVRYVSIPIPNANGRRGWRFRVAMPASLRQSGWSGADRGRHFDVVVRSVPRIPNRLPEVRPNQRALMRLETRRPTFAQTIAEMEWSRTGVGAAGVPTWRTSLQYSDGPANANEKGLYANSETYPGSDPHQKTADALGRALLRLHTRRFEHPVRELDLTGQPTERAFSFQAALLSGQTIEALCHETGLWELEFVSPSRYGAWAAHWLMGVSEGRTVWPPEIDVFEHFNGVYGDWNSERETSAALHYGPFGEGRVGACGAALDLGHVGFPRSIDLTGQVHRSQCLIDRDFITVFMDGFEIVQFRHILKPLKPGDTKRFHPLINVAVAPANENDIYTMGSGDMLVYGYSYYALTDIRLYPANAEIAPAPAVVRRDG